MGSLPFEKKRELLVRKEEPVIEEYGCLPHKRAIEEHLEKGIVNLDKPVGPTSAQVSEWVKTVLHIEKAGHAGTLDPNVSGVFPIGLNQGTKVMQALLLGGKEYVVLMHLHDQIPENEIKAALTDFTGKIFQKPPLRSAVKRLLRVREIYYNKLLELEGNDVLFRTGCSAGTYIRRLCHDLGLILGTGAHMQQLRRTKSGSFNDAGVVNLQALTDAYIFWKEDKNETELRKVVQPMETALAHLPKIVISDHAINSVCHGAQLAVPGVLKLESGIEAGNMVGVFSQKGEAILLGTALMSSDEMHKAKKGFAIKTERVLMDEDYYPKFKKA